VPLYLFIYSRKRVFTSPSPSLSLSFSPACTTRFSARAQRVSRRRVNDILFEKFLSTRRRCRTDFREKTKKIHRFGLNRVDCYAHALRAKRRRGRRARCNVCQYAFWRKILLSLKGRNNKRIKKKYEKIISTATFP